MAGRGPRPRQSESELTSGDLLDLLQPLLVILVSALLLLVYFRRSLLTGSVIWFSFLAYFLAIAGKEAFQLAVPVPSDPVVAGAYYGLQTALLEVGLAYVFARYALTRGRMRVDQAPAYGATLAFWENGVLLGLLAIPGLVVVIAIGGAGLPGSLGTVLQLVALGTIERLGSIPRPLLLGHPRRGGSRLEEDEVPPRGPPYGARRFPGPIRPLAGTPRVRGDRLRPSGTEPIGHLHDDQG